MTTLRLNETGVEETSVDMSSVPCVPAHRQAAVRRIPVVFSTEALTLTGTVDPGDALSGLSGDEAWVRDVEAAAACDQESLWLVALGFEGSSPAVAHRLDGAAWSASGHADVGAGARSAGDAQVPLRVTQVPDDAEYAFNVSTALQRIGSGGVEKVVLGRWIDVESVGEIDLATLTASLLQTRPGRYAYCLPVSEPVSDPVSGTIPSAGASAQTRTHASAITEAHLVGASPELLVKREGTVVSAMPLAGSIPRSADPIEDERRRVSLLTSAKDLREHAYVVADLTSRLRGAGVRLDETPAVQVIGTDAMWHLATPLTGEVEVDGPGALRLAMAVHPTPAVGGVPRTQATALIKELEARPRGWMAGAVGWIDGAGNGEFALTLRSAVVQGNRCSLFAGAGIVGGSVPEAEVAETNAKLSTMLRLLGGVHQ